MKKYLAPVLLVLLFWPCSGLFAQSTPVAGLAKAIYFESSRSEGITVTNIATLNFASSAFTIEAWIKRPANNASFYTIVGKQLTAGGTGYYLRFNGNRLSFAVGSSALANWVDGTTDVTDGAWHHIAAVHDASSKKLSLYIDGVLDNSSTYTTARTVTSSAALGIGYKPNYGEYFDGRIDEVRIWSAARTVAQLKEYMFTPLAGNEPGLAAYWNFEEGAGTATDDRSTNNNTGTIINGDGDEWEDGGISYNASLDEDGQLSLRLGGSDADDQQTATALISQLPAHGKLYQTNDGSTRLTEITATSTSLSDANGNPRRVIYVPDADYNGSDNFQFRVSDGSNTSANTVTVNLSIAPMPETGLWTGAVSVDFQAPGNWDDGIVPTSSTNVTIPSGAARMPSLTAAASINNLLLQHAATLSLNGQSFTVNGNITIAGSGKLIGSSTSSLNLSGNSTSTLSFDQASDGSGNALANLSINGSGSTVTLTNKLNIYTLLTIAAGTFDLNGNTVVIKSTSISNTAMVGQVNGTIQYGSGGKFTAERYIPSGKRSYRLLAPGVSGSAGGTTISTIYENWQNGGTYTAGIGTHITGNGSNGTDLTQTAQHSLFTYNPGALNYTAVSSTSQPNDTLSAIKGYRLFIRGDRAASNLTQLNNSGNGTPNISMNTATTLSASGRLLAGTIVFNKTATSISGADGWAWQNPNAPLTTGTGADDSYSLLPNPYLAMIDWNSVGINDLSTTYYTWDPNKNLRGGYESYNRSTGIASSSNISRYIQPGQGFFVQTTGADPSLTIAETDKNTTGANLVTAFRPQTAMPRIDVAMAYSSRSTVVADNCIAIYDNSFSAGIGAEDSYKLVNPDDNIAIVSNNTQLGVEGRPVITSGDTLALRLFSLQTDTVYTITVQAEHFSLPAGYAGYLEDRYTNTSTVLNMGGTITRQFTKLADSASFYNRFRIVFRPGGPLPIEINHVKAYEKGTGNQVEWSNMSETQVKNYTVERSSDGARFHTVATVEAKANNMTAATYGWYDASPYSGINYYRIRSNGVSGAIHYSTVVKVNRSRTAATMSIYPNPVKAGYIMVQMDGFDKGTYLLQLYSMTGQYMMGKEISHDGGSASETILLQRRSKGAYRVTLTGGNMRLQQTIIIE